MSSERRSTAGSAYTWQSLNTAAQYFREDSSQAVEVAGEMSVLHAAHGVSFSKMTLVACVGSLFNRVPQRIGTKHDPSLTGQEVTDRVASHPGRHFLPADQKREGIVGIFFHNQGFF
jgi:hypothetical protein